MFKFRISLKKELLLLLNDRIGLLLMFLMPVLLVFIITIIQDSAFKMVNENKISLVIANNDKGKLGSKLIEMLSKSSMFLITSKTGMDSLTVKTDVQNSNSLTGLYIAEDFSEKITTKSNRLGQIILNNLGFGDSVSSEKINPPGILFYHDPILQENYCYSIINLIHSQLDIIENFEMLKSIYSQMDYDSIPANITDNIVNNKIIIERKNTNTTELIPNSTQHNVPAWTIFAMFFMVISLGGSIVAEKTSGSFVRLKTMPSSLYIVMFSKQLVYLMVGVLQVFFIFSIGVFVFPFINLPPLIIPSNILGTIVIIFGSSFASVSYSFMLGTLAKTRDQSNGVGAISIIIFAAIGGVWIPSFVMPEYMKIIAKVSPLHWCIEAFYIIFLKNGEWTKLLKPFFILIIFSLFCQTVSIIKLKKEKLI